MKNDFPPVRFAGIRGNAVLLAQQFVGAVLADGALAVDATMGNGHDTLFLARLVGSTGRVYAFDIQPAAIAATKAVLVAHVLLDRVTLVHGGHERMNEYLAGPVDAFLFNLGYLPGGDHSVTTTPAGTAQALRIALDALKPGGRIGIVVYTGHPGAGEESKTVEDIVTCLDPGVFGVLKVEFANRTDRAPFLILIERVLAGK